MSKNKKYQNFIWSDRLEEILKRANAAGGLSDVMDAADESVSTSELDASDVFDAIQTGFKLRQMQQAGPAGIRVFAAADHDEEGAPILFFLGRSEDEVVERILPVVEAVERLWQQVEEKKKKFPTGASFTEMADAIGLLALDKDRESYATERRFPNAAGKHVVERVKVISRRVSPGVKAYAARLHYMAPKRAVLGGPEYWDEEGAMRALFEFIVAKGLPIPARRG